MKYYFPITANERITISIDLTERLLSGVTMISATLAARNVRTGENVTGAILPSSTGTILDNSVLGAVWHCVSGALYEMTILVTLSNSDVLEENVILEVR